MFIYVRQDALERPEIAAFVKFYLDNAGALIPEVGYVPLAPESYAESLARIAG